MVLSTPLGSFNLIMTSIHDRCSDWMKITTHLHHISHCKAAFGTHWSKRWTHRVFIINTRLNSIPSRDSRWAGREEHTVPESGGSNQEVERRVIRTSDYDRYPGSMKITTHLDHVSLVKQHLVQIVRTDGLNGCLSQILAITGVWQVKRGLGHIQDSVLSAATRTWHM